MTESKLIERIRQRHPAPAYAVLSHVRNQTGYRKARVRTADALALSVWPSNGLTLHGFEVKCTASDLRKELNDPSKPAEFSVYCDYWWIVVADANLIKGVEIPIQWGVLSPHGKSLKVERAAPKLDAKPFDRELVCSMIRNFSESTEARFKRMVSLESVEDVVKERLDAHVKSIRHDAERRLKDLDAAVQEFEQASGVSVRNRWDAGQIGKAVKLIRRHGLERITEAAKAEIARAKEFVAALEKFCESDAEPVLSSAGELDDF